MRKLLFIGFVAGATAFAVKAWPDVARYLKIRDM